MATFISDLGKSLSDSVSETSRSGVDAMRTALRSTEPFLEAYTQFLEMMAEQAAKLGSRCCEIPETDCPPRCAHTMRWRTCIGDTRRGAIRIENTSRDSITYSLEATEFRSANRASGAKPAITPEALTIPRDESGVVDLEITVGDGFIPGHQYESELRIRGKYDRCIRLVLAVEDCCDEFFELEHGEIPTRIRADRWYRHFQCTDLCFEPVNQLRPQNRPGGDTT